jgi:hypothetical protein
MKKIFAAFFVTLVTFPIAGFACGGGDCSGMELPPPPVPPPGPMDNLASALSDHAGLATGLVLAGILAVLAARQRKLVEIASAAPSFVGGTS